MIINRLDTAPINNSKELIGRKDIIRFLNDKIDKGENWVICGEKGMGKSSIIQSMFYDHYGTMREYYYTKYKMLVLLYEVTVKTSDKKEFYENLLVELDNAAEILRTTDQAGYEIYENAKTHATKNCSNFGLIFQNLVKELVLKEFRFLIVIDCFEHLLKIADAKLSNEEFITLRDLVDKNRMVTCLIASEKTVTDVARGVQGSDFETTLQFKNIKPFSKIDTDTFLNDVFREDSLSEEVKDYIFKITGGVPSFVRNVASGLRKKQTMDDITYDIIMELFLKECDILCKAWLENTSYEGIVCIHEILSDSKYYNITGESILTSNSICYSDVRSGKLRFYSKGFEEYVTLHSDHLFDYMKPIEWENREVLTKEEKNILTQWGIETSSDNKLVQKLNRLLRFENFIIVDENGDIKMNETMQELYRVILPKLEETPDYIDKDALLHSKDSWNILEKNEIVYGFLKQGEVSYQKLKSKIMKVEEEYTNLRESGLSPFNILKSTKKSSKNYNNTEYSSASYEICKAMDQILNQYLLQAMKRRDKINIGKKPRHRGGLIGYASTLDMGEFAYLFPNPVEYASSNSLEDPYRDSMIEYIKNLSDNGKPITDEYIKEFGDYIWTLREIRNSVDHAIHDNSTPVNEMTYCVLRDIVYNKEFNLIDSVIAFSK